MNRVEGLLRTGPDGAEYADGYLRYLASVFSLIDREAIAAFIEVLLDARRRDAQIFFVGNGGSAATASHWVNDLTRWRDRPFRAISLTENVAVMTAYANDFGYDKVFVRQLETLMEPGDVVVALSASGNSQNIVLAIEYANAHGAVTVGLTGFNGGRLREIASIAVHAPTNEGEYGPAEDVHMVLDHLVTSFLEHHCGQERP
ncbi:MAG: SIS domain-containing protein [Actinobacteria bacterium]|nr:SIS domain-containing protein [Actinomycetota bacterium]